jgi:hypothetical protein
MTTRGLRVASPPSRPEADNTRILSHAYLDRHAEQHHRVGINVATNLLQVLRLEDLRERALATPHARLHALLEVIGSVRLVLLPAECGHVGGPCGPPGIAPAGTSRTGDRLGQGGLVSGCAMFSTGQHCYGGGHLSTGAALVAIWSRYTPPAGSVPGSTNRRLLSVSVRTSASLLGTPTAEAPSPALGACHSAVPRSAVLACRR